MITHNLQWLKKQSDNNLDKNKQMLKSFNAKVPLSLNLIRQAPASANVASSMFSEENEGCN